MIAQKLCYCPSCGQQTFQPESNKAFRCTDCRFILYQNASAAVAAIIECEGEVLLTVRALDPGKGMLDLPGGFVDNGESAEAAMERELAEEIDIRPLPLVYFGSYPNTYPFNGVVYSTLDLIYTCRLERMPELEAKDDVAEVIWARKAKIPFERMAFTSLKQALADYCSSNTKSEPCQCCDRSVR